MKKKFKISGFTLIELLTVVAVIVIIAGIIFAGSIQSSFQKARDSKRKQDLNKMLRVVEDYYNDKEDYPPANDPTDGNIAGAPWGSPFASYVPELPKDPLSPNRDYYYQVNQGTKKFFVIYAKLENKSDPEIIRVGCQDGCGPIGPDGKRAYNYFVSSPNVVLLAGIPAGFDPGLDPTRAPVTSPTATGPPVTPTPTFNPIPPAGPDACAHNQCCSLHDCGNIIKPPGVYCGPQAKCWYQNIVPPFGWQCKDAFVPPENC